MTLVGGETNCDWNIYYIKDHDDYLDRIESLGVPIEPGYIQAGITFFDLKEIYVSATYGHWRDELGNTAVVHEIIHAVLYEQTQIDHLYAIYLAEAFGVNINLAKPWAYHE